MAFRKVNPTPNIKPTSQLLFHPNLARSINMGVNTEGPRRSTRSRKQVKTYAEEQAEQNDVATHTIPQKGKRKKPIDSDEETKVFKPEKSTKKASKKKKTEEESSDEQDENIGKTRVRKGVKRLVYKVEAEPENWHADAAERRIAVAKRNVQKLYPGEEETRLKSYVEDPPDSYIKALKKANTERMFVLNRERGVEDDCHANHTDCPCESLQVAGSTGMYTLKCSHEDSRSPCGVVLLFECINRLISYETSADPHIYISGNVYNVTISHVPSCTCPAGVFSRKGEEKLCKHALYVLHNVLKAPDHLKRQNALLTSELKEIFSNAPALPSETVQEESKDGNRKDLSDDCPICFMELEEDEDIVRKAFPEIVAGQIGFWRALWLPRHVGILETLADLF